MSCPPPRRSGLPWWLHPAWRAVRARYGGRHRRGSAPSEIRWREAEERQRPAPEEGQPYDTASPALGEVLRVHPAPLALPELRANSAGHGRFDDPDGCYAVRYAASALYGCLVETMVSRFADDPATEAILATVSHAGDPPEIERAYADRSVAVDEWLDRQKVGTLRLPSRQLQFVEVESAQLLSDLSEQPSPGAASARPVWLGLIDATGPSRPGNHLPRRTEGPAHHPGRVGCHPSVHPRSTRHRLLVAIGPRCPLLGHLRERVRDAEPGEAPHPPRPGAPEGCG